MLCYINCYALHWKSQGNYVSDMPVVWTQGISNILSSAWVSWYKWFQPILQVNLFKVKESQPSYTGWWQSCYEVIIKSNISILSLLHNVFVVCYSLKFSLTSLKWEYFHFDGISISGFPRSCHFDDVNVAILFNIGPHRNERFTFLVLGRIIWKLILLKLLAEYNLTDYANSIETKWRASAHFLR